MSLKQIAPDELFSVLEFLPLCDLGRILSVCKEWQELDGSEAFWTFILTRELERELVECVESIQLLTVDHPILAFAKLTSRDEIIKIIRNIQSIPMLKMKKIPSQWKDSQLFTVFRTKLTLLVTNYEVNILQLPKKAKRKTDVLLPGKKPKHLLEQCITASRTIESRSYLQHLKSVQNRDDSFRELITQLCSMLNCSKNLLISKPVPKKAITVWEQTRRDFIKKSVPIVLRNKYFLSQHETVYLLDLFFSGLHKENVKKECVNDCIDLFFDFFNWRVTFNEITSLFCGYKSQLLNYIEKIAGKLLERGVNAVDMEKNTNIFFQDALQRPFEAQLKIITLYLEHFSGFIDESAWKSFYSKQFLLQCSKVDRKKDLRRLLEVLKPKVEWFVLDFSNIVKFNQLLKFCKVIEERGKKFEIVDICNLMRFCVNCQIGVPVTVAVLDYFKISSLDFYRIEEEIGLVRTVLSGTTSLKVVAQFLGGTVIDSARLNNKKELLSKKLFSFDEPDALLKLLSQQVKPSIFSVELLQHVLELKREHYTARLFPSIFETLISLTFYNGENLEEFIKKAREGEFKDFSNTNFLDYSGPESVIALYNAVSKEIG